MFEQIVFVDADLELQGITSNYIYRCQAFKWEKLPIRITEIIVQATGPPHNLICNNFGGHGVLVLKGLEANGAF